MAKDKRYYYVLSFKTMVKRCRIKDVYIGSDACLQCHNCEENCEINIRASSIQIAKEKYIICKVITKATGGRNGKG